jgi:hypothetical protein
MLYYQKATTSRGAIVPPLAVNEGAMTVASTSGNADEEGDTPADYYNTAHH